MEKLELKHIAPYLPYGLKCQCRDLGILELTGVSTINKDYPCWFESAMDYNNRDFNYRILSQNSQCGIGFSLDKVKPLLRPLSDLYKEIDGKVGIVELANICNQDFKWEKHLNLAAIYGKYSFEYIEDGIYFVLSELGCRLSTPNQLDLFTYLFSHHYDIYKLIDKGLAINLNSISHE